MSEYIYIYNKHVLSADRSRLGSKVVKEISVGTYGNIILVKQFDKLLISCQSRVSISYSQNKHRTQTMAG